MHDTRQVIYMEKPLLTAWLVCKLGWAEPQGITMVEQSVLARLMESQKWRLPAGSMALRGKGSENE